MEGLGMMAHALNPSNSVGGGGVAQADLCELQDSQDNMDSV